MNSDPRILKAIENLRELKNIYVVLSSKGGVGKTTVSTLLALYSSVQGYRVGLLDIDLINPSTHVFLGLKPDMLKYEEEYGILPYRIGTLYYFSIVAYTSDRPLALRGSSVRNALWEILAIVNWDKIDMLFIDTPPGLGDEHLELVYVMRKYIKPIVVTTPSPLALNSTKKLLTIIKDIGFSKIYLIENMGNRILEKEAREWNTIYLGYIPYSSKLEEYIGNMNRLLELDVKDNIQEILARLIK